jgi:hypothetical protein
MNVGKNNSFVMITFQHNYRIKISRFT